MFSKNWQKNNAKSCSAFPSTSGSSRVLPYIYLVVFGRRSWLGSLMLALSSCFW